MKTEEINQDIDKLIQLQKSSQNEEAKVFGLQLLNLLEIQNDEKVVGKIYTVLGDVFYSLSEFSTAIIYLEKALEVHKNLEFKDKFADNLKNIGVVYDRLSDYPKALEYYEKSIQIYSEIKNKLGVANNFTNLGIVYHRLFEYEKALKYHNESLLINQSIQNIEGIAVNFGNIGNVYIVLKKYTLALENLQKALHMQESSNYKMAVAGNLGNIGIVYLYLKQYEKALEYFFKALQINKEIGNLRGLAINLANISSVYNDQGKFTLALKTSKQSFSIAKKIEAKDLINTHFDLSYKVVEKQGKYKEALNFYKKSMLILDEIQSEVTKKNAILFDQKRILEEDEKARQLKFVRFQEQEKIFHKILPISIANRLIEGEQTIAESFDNICIFFSDLVGFTTLSSFISPTELVQGLNKIFTAFDRIGSKYGLERIKTIGDAYMAVCGVPTPIEDQSYRTTKFAIEIVDLLDTIELGDSFKGLQIRIGLHSGNVVAGIIGETKFAYDVWGDAVNVASRMESHSEPGRIHISETFAKSIEHYPEFKLIPRGEINIKGKGTMNTFWLEKATEMLPSK